MKKEAFTIVEILITLGVVAIVAALTIPVIVQNVTTKKFVTSFKKSLSTLNQAAIRTIAQYDMDYSAIDIVSKDETCKNDTFQNGEYSFCGLLNSSLSGHKYLGKYGNFKDANGENPYSATVINLPINNYLFFELSDGMFVAFNPNIKKCGIGFGNRIKTTMLTEGELVNCIGFVDVNGPNPPNREIQCETENTKISVDTTCEVTGTSIGDIFPIVFHDGIAAPATNASLTAFLGGNEKGTQK